MAKDEVQDREVAAPAAPTQVNPNLIIQDLSNQLAEKCQELALVRAAHKQLLDAHTDLINAQRKEGSGDDTTETPT